VGKNFVFATWCKYAAINIISKPEIDGAIMLGDQMMPTSIHTPGGSLEKSRFNLESPKYCFVNTHVNCGLPPTFPVGGRMIWIL
jgi:hypothetical protein